MNEENERRLNGTEREPPEINKQEDKEALKEMKSGEATRPDEILAKMCKSLGEEGVNAVRQLTKKVCNQETMPEGDCYCTNALKQR